MANNSDSEKSDKKSDRLKEGETAGNSKAGDYVAQSAVIGGRNQQQHQQDYQAHKQTNNQETPSAQAIKAINPNDPNYEALVKQIRDNSLEILGEEPRKSRQTRIVEDTPPPGSAEDTGVVTDYPAEKLENTKFALGSNWTEGKSHTENTRIRAENLDSATLKALEVNPSKKIRECVQSMNLIRDGLKTHLPEGEQRDRLDLDIKQKVADFLNNDGTGAIDSTGDLEPPLSNSPGGWLSAMQKIAALPLEKQQEIIGTALKQAVDQLQIEQRERSIGQTIGIVEGVGDVVISMATIAEFTCDVVAGNKERAEKRGAEFGEALGKTVVGGIQLFHAADNYLFNIGYTGDYGKPFQDIVTLGEVLDEKWSQMPLREQERLKARILTDVTAGIAFPVAGDKFKKASKLTTLLDDMATLAKQPIASANEVAKIGTVAGDIAKRADDTAIKIGDSLNDFLFPNRLKQAYATAHGGGEEMGALGKFRRQRDLDETHNLAMAGENGEGKPRWWSKRKSGQDKPSDEERHEPPRILTPDEARKEALDKIVDFSPELLAHQKLGREVLEQSDSKVIELLHNSSHVFHFPESMERLLNTTAKALGDVPNRLAQIENLPGMTFRKFD